MAAQRPKYPGPADAVTIDLSDGSSVTVKKGHQVPQEVPEDIRDKLVEQWAPREDVAFTHAQEPEPVTTEATQPDPAAGEQSTTKKEG